MFDDILNIKLYKHTEYNDLKKELIDNENIATANHFLNKILGTEHYPVSMKKTRIFLASYLIVKYPSDFTETLHKEAVSLHQTIVDRNQEGFRISFNQYFENFNKWKLADLYSALHELTELIAFFEKADEKYKHVLDDLVKQHKQIKDMVDREDPEHKFASPPKESYCQSIYEIAERAYWNVYDEELKVNDHKRTIELLNEIKIRLKQLIPSREDLHQNLDDSIDIDLIKQMIEHNAFNNQDIKKLALYIGHFIRNLEAIEDDVDTDAWIKTIEEDKCTLVDLFKTAFRKIEKVESDRERFRQFVMREIQQQ